MNHLYLNTTNGDNENATLHALCNSCHVEAGFPAKDLGETVRNCESCNRVSYRSHRLNDADLNSQLLVAVEEAVAVVVVVQVVEGLCSYPTISKNQAKILIENATQRNVKVEWMWSSDDKVIIGC